MTPLGLRLAETIRRDGPIGVDAFMAAALSDTEHGYYQTRDPLGVAGDFTTAPEISQVFGEIIGLWLLDQWESLGGPDPVQLVELGPGRGTLMADLLRATTVLPTARSAIRLHLVETSPVLRQRQAETLHRFHPDIAPCWHDTLDTVPPGPLLLVANEFFDALPIRQWLCRAGNWHERRVGLNGAGRFVFTVGPAGIPVGAPPPGTEGAIFETADLGLAVAQEIGTRLATAPGAALIIDYGHEHTAHGETLQAVRAHRYANVLEDPGEADLTAHVDFAALSRALETAGAQASGPTSQRAFLTLNGAEQRRLTLTRGKPLAESDKISHALNRLLDPAQMGSLFKVLAATSPGRPVPSGFQRGSAAE